MLLERLLELFSELGGDGATFAGRWDAGHWGLRDPWRALELDEWSRAAVRRWIQEYRRRNAGGDEQAPPLESPVAMCLDDLPGQLIPTSQATTVGELDADSLRLRQRLVERTRQPLELARLVPPGSVWLRVFFTGQGQLRWWAWRPWDGRLELLAEGASSDPRAREQLEAANRQFDQAMDRAWQGTQRALDEHMLAQLDRFKQMLTQPAVRASVLASAADREAVSSLASVFAEWRQALPCWAESGQALLEWVLDPGASAAAFPWSAWEFWKLNSEDQRRAEFDAISRAHLAAVQAHLNLEPLFQAAGGRFDWSETDLLFQVSGPLLLAPLAWLPFGGGPLFTQVASTSSILSLVLRDVVSELADQEAGAAERERPGDQWPARRLMSVQWEEPDPERRTRCCGLPLLHAGVRLAARQNNWETWSLGDEPLATVANLRAGIGTKRCGVVVVGAHGNRGEAGVVLSASELWRGDGVKLRDVDLLVLVSCAVGRLEANGSRDVEGLVTQLLAHQGRTVVAARWKIADLEAAELGVELVRQYLAALPASGRPARFARARALNAARRALLADQRISFHLASAFELYGLG